MSFNLSWFENHSDIFYREWWKGTVLNKCFNCQVKKIMQVFLPSLYTLTSKASGTHAGGWREHVSDRGGAYGGEKFAEEALLDLVKMLWHHQEREEGRRQLGMEMIEIGFAALKWVAIPFDYLDLSSFWSLIAKVPSFTVMTNLIFCKYCLYICLNFSSGFL